ncbi:MAG: 7-carboxy-7-deazaguanine synthase QueE [Chthoniobacterales bacterium]
MSAAAPGMPARYPLSRNPIFWTIQGEGHMRGLQMCFVRLAGCSVGCPGCDTDYRKNEIATLDEIVRRVEEAIPAAARERWVWLTGGEPTDHNLEPLVSALHAKGFRIALATSGHRKVVVTVDWLSVSPHDPSQWVQTRGNEMKIVPDLNGFAIEAFRRAHADETTDFRYRFVQPLSIGKAEDPVSLQTCLEFIRAHPNWRLSRQDHHYWDVA